MKRTHIAEAAVVAGLLAIPLGSNCLGATAFVGLNLTNTVTGTMDAPVGFGGDTWYERGVNTNSPASGLQTGIVAAEYDPLSTYLLAPATGNNALALSTNNANGRLTFSRPISVTALSLAAASGHGTGTNILTLNFSDNTSDTLPAVGVFDWFNHTPRIETANGRINILGNTFDNVDSDNPRLLAVNLNLPIADQSKLITSIDLTWSGQNANTVTAIFGVSGDVTGIGHFTAIPLTGESFNQDLIVGLAEVPEPGTMVLFGLGAAGLFACLRRKNA